MGRTLVNGLAAGAVAAAAALALASAGAAATITVSIKSTGFSPATITIQHGDRVTWRNVDTQDHQVVANDGSFASPILHRNQSWTKTLSTAGTFRYHDALAPRLTGKVTVKGPPPSLSLALSAPIVFYGSQTTLAGTVSSGAANQSIEIDAQPWGQAAPSRLAVVKTATGGAFAFAVTPSLYTTYSAHWGSVDSSPVVVQVAPKIRLIPGGAGYMKAVVSTPVSLWHRHVYLQRLSPFGQWVNIASLALGEQNGRLFRPAAYLPRGSSHIRVFLSINQAGNGLLASHSGTQTIVRRR
jgi:plastocyanin